MGELRTLRDKQMAINLQLEELTGVLTRVKGMLERLNLAEIENLKKQQKQMEEGRESSWESLEEISGNFNETLKKIRQIDSELLKIQVEYKKKQIDKSIVGLTLRNLGEIWKFQLAEYTYYILLVEAIRYLLVPEKTRFKEGLKTFIQWDKLSPDSKLITPDNMKKWVGELSKNIQPLLLKLLEEKTDLTKLFTYSDNEKKLIEGISLLRGILAPEEQYQFLETKTIKDIKNVIDTKMKILGDNRIANSLSGLTPISTVVPPTAPISEPPTVPIGVPPTASIDVAERIVIPKPILRQEIPETTPIDIEERIVVPRKPERIVPKPILRPEISPIDVEEKIAVKPGIRPVRVETKYEIRDEPRIDRPIRRVGEKPWLRVEDSDLRERPQPMRRRVGEDMYDISRYERPIRREERIESKAKDRLPLVVVEIKK